MTLLSVFVIVAISIILLQWPLGALIEYIMHTIRLKKSMKKTRKVALAAVVKDKERQEAEEELRKESQEKIDYMKSLGLEEARCINFSMWILRDENGRIKELYDTDAKRMPLANLAMTRNAKTIGIEPDIYYFNDKITKSQMLNDELEIDKLNRL